jgi:hypothetical protein
MSTEFIYVSGMIAPCPCGNACHERVHIDHTRLLLGAPPRVICPACGGPMREVPGFDDYCPPCRLREELDRERRRARGRDRLMEAIHAQ